MEDTSMNEDPVATGGDTSSEESSDWELESLVEQVWDDLTGKVPRSTISQTLAGLLAKYDDATIRRYVPLLVRKEAGELLRAAAVIETEVKFAVSDPCLFWRLQTSRHLAGYVLSPPRVKPVWDTYLDTRQRRILVAGYSCRRRETREDIVSTLKSLGRAQGALHRRQEWSVKLKGRQQPIEWPDSPVRDRILRLIGGEPLLPLFDLRQTRIIRVVQQDKQPVAELSLDSITLTIEGREHLYQELEVELLPSTPEELLATITACLQEEWNLRPESRSKFERALALLDSTTARAKSERMSRRRGKGLILTHQLVQEGMTTAPMRRLVTSAGNLHRHS